MNWTLITIMIMAVGTVTAGIIVSLKGKRTSGSRTLPIISYRPILSTPWGDKIVMHSQRIGEQFYQLSFEDGTPLRAHITEIFPLNSIETMCRNNTPGGRDKWVFRPTFTTEEIKRHLVVPLPQQPTMEEYLRLERQAAIDAANAEQTDLELSNMRENQAEDIKAAAELAKSSAPRMPTRRPGGTT